MKLLFHLSVELQREVPENTLKRLGKPERERATGDIDRGAQTFLAGVMVALEDGGGPLAPARAALSEWLQAP
jgi:hypothetical protein